MNFPTNGIKFKFNKSVKVYRQLMDFKVGIKHEDIIWIGS